METRKIIKTSRKKFFYLYIFGLLVIILYPISEFAVIGGIYNYLFYATVLIVLLYPEINIFYTSYFIGKDVIIETRGFIAKKRTTIPISSISHVVMNKGITGTFLNFGDIVVTSFTDLIIVFEGISNPEKLLNRIEDMIEKGQNKKG